MNDTEPTSLDRFDALREQGRSQVARGQLEEALATYTEAMACAESTGDRTNHDLAFCNLAAVRVALGTGQEILSRLRLVFMGSSDSMNRYLAAHTISVHYERIKDHEKGLFYARIALDHARKTGHNEFVAMCLNRIGNALVAESYFAEARERYLEALPLYEEPSLDHTRLLGNLGYCHVVLEELPEGFSALFRSWRMLRRLGLEVDTEVLVHLDLCYAYLEIDRLRSARRHGLRALELADERGTDEQVKNCLYLLGEVEKLSGESFSAFSYFSRLQNDFYPDNGMIPHLLMTADVRPLVNLRA